MSSATERPSRAPSTTKSVMRAMASGWLSLTPRSSRRRATIAAMAIKSLSFSRGVRFINRPLIQPQPRQRLVTQCRQYADQIAMQRGAIRRDQARDRKPVPCRYPDFADEVRLLRADRGDIAFIAGKLEHAGDGHAASGD